MFNKDYEEKIFKKKAKIAIATLKPEGICTVCSIMFPQQKRISVEFSFSNKYFTFVAH